MLNLFHVFDFYQLFGCPKTSFGPLTRRQLHLRNFNYCTLSYWAPSSSGKGPSKWVLPVFPSVFSSVILSVLLFVLLSILPSVLFCPFCLCRSFLRILSLVFSKFWLGARNQYEVVLDRVGFSGKKFTSKIGKMDQKCARNRVFWIYWNI